MIADLFAQGLKDTGVLRVLQTVRKYLGMDVAFVSHFREHDRVLEHVDADAAATFYAGQVIPLEQGYCRRVARGELPELMADTSLFPAAVALPETSAVPIGSHLSVPIRLLSGALYGTLCCFSYQPDLTLGERELRLMHAFAEVLAAHIEAASSASSALSAKLASVREAMSGTSPRIVYQPIYHLKTGALAGFECLSRFGVPAATSSPVHWFDLASEVGLRTELEILAIRRALETMHRFPEWTGFGLNGSPETILSDGFTQALEGADLRRVVIEITEHAIVEDYAPLRAVLQPLREQGLRLAIDDAGAGYANMRHIVNLIPDIIKLDMSLTRHIDRDPHRRALARALISFSEETGSRITAEGIETQAELQLLRDLGAETGQGYFLKEPVALELACDPALHKCHIPTDQIHLAI